MIDAVLLCLVYLLALIVNLSCIYFVVSKVLEVLHEFLGQVEQELEGKGNGYEEEQETESGKSDS